MHFRSLRLDGEPPPPAPRPAPDFLTLPERTAKPRRAGITHVLDRGLSPLTLESLLITAGEHIDLIKLGWGTAYVSGAVADKVAICRDAGIALCPGGTLLEIAAAQDRVDAYADWLSGAVHADLVEAILHAVGHATVIFEAPQRTQQAWLLRHVGPNVNLGNIGAEDVIALETLRRGLGFDTLDLLPG